MSPKQRSVQPNRGTVPINEEHPALPVGRFEADPDGRVVAADDAFAALVGARSSVIGSAPWAGAAPDERAAAEAVWRAGVGAGGTIRLTFHIVGASGRSQAIRIDAAPGAGGYAGWALRDDEAAAGSELLARLLAVVGSTGSAVALFDRDGATVFVNAAARALFGVGEGDTDGEAARALLDAVRHQVPRHVLADVETSTWSGEVGLRTPDGLERTVHVELLAQRRRGVTDFWGVTARDVTDSKRVHAELTRQATHDAPTGLPNRVYFLRLAARALERSREIRSEVAIVFLDVDRLKEVNDTAGHDAGDALIATVAERLDHALRPADVVGRIGGDEFAVLCEGAIDEHTALDIAERLRRAITGRITVLGVEIELGASVGVAVAAGGSATAGSADAALALLRHADSAMYLAKRRGRGRAELYSDAMRATSEAARRLSNELERALAAGELFVVHQPVVAVHSGRTVGAEALIRWRHPERGVLLPADFIGLAEDSGAIVPIGEWVIATACADAARWLEAGIVDRSFRVHVNVAVRQLTDRDFVERVRAALHAAGLGAHHLVLDAPEAAFGGPGRRSLQALGREGVRVALDGFGAGASSLTTLRDGGADLLKLDGHVTESIEGDDGEDPVVRAVVQVAHALNMQVIAQWVRTPTQLRRLRALGCDLAQGNLFGQPVTADEFSAR